MLPRTLRAALGRHELPAWLREAAGLPDGATVESLGPELDHSALELFGRRIELFLVRLLESNRAAVRRVRVLDRPWPASLDPASVQWPARARRLRDSEHAADAASLSRVTYGELFAVPRVAERAVFAFAVAAESALDHACAGIDPPPELVELGERVAREPWASCVHGDDPRFSDLLPAGSSALSESAAWQLPAVCERVAQIEREPLDDALRAYVAALGGLEAERLDAVLGRLGLDGQPPRSLTNALNGSQLTPERIRQLQLRVLRRRPARTAYIPALDRALAHLAECAPCTAAAAAESLHASGLASIPFHPASVLAAARFCGAVPGIVLEAARGDEIVLREATSTWTPTLVRLATQRARRFGAASISGLASVARAADVELGTEEARALIETFTDAEFLDDDWFWLPRFRGGRLESLTCRILAVASPLEVAVVRAGVCRAYRRREAAFVPPESVLAALYRTHPSFEVDAHDRIGAADSVDYSAFLGKNDRLFVDVFTESSAGVLDSASFRIACLARGMTPYVFALNRTYSVVLDRPADDLWCLRGTVR